MSATEAGHLPVPGASLYYEVRGTGPALLVIAGGNGDAGPFGAVADELARRYTVITYDRRGFSRSVLDWPADDARRLDEDVQDALALLDRFGDGPGVVLGSCSGATLALDLVVRHPERIETLVAHEPPVAAVLPDLDEWIEFYAAVYKTFRTEGVQEGMRVFRVGMGMTKPARPPESAQLPQPQLEQMLARIKRNHGYWLEHEMRTYSMFEPDIARLRTVTDRLVIAGGSDEQENHPYLCTVALAERLDQSVVDFPGGHVGYVTDPYTFADATIALLESRRTPSAAAVREA
ncbi:alpha/beta fold hydrolase [Dactylosporangium sp. CS-033363]|uniref:alpha/beta fold hydrolase n=1 Tax=Dactylosporangium sp. CS-033363 TaxID=3239935 RepID=UPI003D8B6CEC